MSTAVADAPARIPDSAIDPRAVIEADWDSENLSQEPWRVTDGRGNVLAAGHDPALAVRLGYHRMAAHAQRDAANAEARAAQDALDAKDRADFDAWRRERDDPGAAEREALAARAAAQERADFDAFRSARA